MRLLAALALVSLAARAQDAGVVLEGAASVTTDAGVMLLPSAVCLDETAAVRVARELAARRAAEPVLRETPPATPGAVLVVGAVAATVGVALGVYAGVRFCAETGACR